MSTPKRPKDFLREIIDEHAAAGTYGGRVATRFPPEPNGYLHVGHAKSICLNFGLAREYGGTCNLRMDDTNPSTEDPEYVEAIARDVRWLGFEPAGLFHASGYFERLYEYAEELIRAQKAYVCSLSEAEVREQRGTVSQPGRESPHRGRSVDENLDLFRRMRAGEFGDGAHTLRAKIDMAAPNMKLRDPPLYRIRRASHYRTGDAWCLYPLYDFAHCLSDSIEGITHSICTLEFENNRDLYDWILDALPSVPRPRPRQYEFARLQLTYTVLSKRKLLQLVQRGLVDGWDDPRMPTLSGLRRRGVTPAGLRRFCETIGVSKHNSVVEVELFEACVRDDLNLTSRRVLGVLEPLELELTNVPEGETRRVTAPYFPPDVPGGAGARELTLSRRLLIEASDFAIDPPPGFTRLVPGGVVRLRHAAALVRCDEVVRDDAGAIVRLRCTLDTTPGARADGTIHWVDAATAIDAEVRLYDRLFSVEAPDAEDADFTTFLSPTSLVTKRAKVEASLADARPGERFQLERTGFFVVDERDSSPGRLVLDRTLPLKDSWGKKPERARPAARAPSPPPAVAKKEHGAATRELAASRGIGLEEAEVLAASPPLLALFDGAVAAGADARTTGTLVASELHRLLRAEGRAADALPFSHREVAELSRLVAAGAVGARGAREVWSELAMSGGSVEEIVQRRGLRVVHDDAALDAAIDATLSSAAALVARYRAGEQKVLGALVGELMKATGGKATPARARERLVARLGGELEMFEHVADGIWTTARRQRFWGVDSGTRMTVVRLSDGGLFVHCPVALDRALRAEVDELGPVRAVAASSLFHHLYVGAWMQAYPRAVFAACPGLAEKRRDLAFSHTLGDTPHPAWSADLEQVSFSARFEREVVFYHRETRTMICADALLNLRRHPSPLTRAVALWMGNLGPGRGWMERFAVTDWRRGRLEVDRMLEWDIDRIVLAHGELVRAGGGRALRDAYDWLPQARAPRRIIQ
ncbi:MAG: glutamine--tRNA ligase/YqeY domain fusion protein [Polyangiaceae bacterium]|nr:glutamine--tRNA ligase/YqeY domain fusion protein [Polyangiaceae bacterium]